MHLRNLSEKRAPKADNGLWPGEVASQPERLAMGFRTDFAGYAGGT